VNALYEIVPNISEGRDPNVVDACAGAVASGGARVVDVTSDREHHRSVITAVGTRDAVLASSVALAGVAAARIDLRRHRGVHPRMGALDVLPFVALRGAGLEDAARLARDAALAIWEAHRIPSYLYGAAAASPERRQLAEVRRGEFEGLESKIASPGGQPDAGDRAHPSAGAIAIGARPLLIAFNLELASGDLEAARRIARTLRGRDGGLHTLRALGLRLGPASVQVSFNITDPDAVPLYRVVELVRRLAAEAGIALRRSELIGLVPRRALERTAAYYSSVQDTGK